MATASTLSILARVASAELTASSPAPAPIIDPIVPIRAPDTTAKDLKSCCSDEASASSSSSVHDDDDDDQAEPDAMPSPIDYLERLFARHGINLTNRRKHKQHNSKPQSQPEPPMWEEVDAYDIETARAVRSGDLPKLRELYHQRGYSLSACNRFGESLLHMCCRRGNAKMVRFMLSEAKVNPRVMDDYGRTAFHDVCWSSQPNLDTMDVLLQVLPPIGLLVQDARGHSPFHYAPRKHWGVWVEYLQEREHIFVQWIRDKRERAAAMRDQKKLLAQQQQKLAQPKLIPVGSKVNLISPPSKAAVVVPPSPTLPPTRAQQVVEMNPSA